MRDRITLAFLMIILFIFVILFQKYIPTPFSIFIVMGFIGLYFFLIQLAQYHRKRSVDRLEKFYPHIQLKDDPDGDTFRAFMPLSRKNFFKLIRSVSKHFKDLRAYEPLVSIVIPAHNEENVIENTILNILEIDYPKFEVLVMDDRSTDNTAKVLEEFNNKYPDKIRYVIRDKNAFPGKSAVLNEALEICNGEVLCIFDADARVDVDFLKKIIPYLASKEVGAVQARKVISNRDYNILTRCQDNEYALDTHFQIGRDAIRGAVELRGNGQLIKKEALIQIKGWNNNTITDDLDISTRLHLKNWDIRFCPYVKVYEEGIINLWPLLRQRRRWMEGSIRRYLDYFIDVIFSKDISMRVSLDMFAYIAEFVLPLWIFSEWCIQGIKFLYGTQNNILISLSILPIVFVFFISALIYGLKKHNDFTNKQAIKQAIETGIYTVLIWTPIVTFIVFKIIFMKRTMDWGKTVHGVASQQDQQRDFSEEITN